MSRIYGSVKTPEDISRINCLIRDEMMTVTNAAELSDLKKRSDYLCTLTYSPFWRKKFGDLIEKLREIAIKENRASVKTANIISEYKGFDKKYEPWKKEINIDEELKKIPDEVVKELSESIFSLKNSVEILEEIRSNFCDIRKASVLCEDKECLDKLKKGVDILSALIYLDSFTAHFDEGVVSVIENLINVEKERSVKLFNIISEVYGWDRYYESISEENFEINADEFIKKLIAEEEKSSTYIPTELKYKGGAKVLWLVYYHPKRKREYAKRIYFPNPVKNIQIEGPGEFKNKFGNKVWGIKISYESEIDEAVIHLRGKEIHLPKRIIKRSKVIQIPKIAENIRITEEKPKSAMDIA